MIMNQWSIVLELLNDDVKARKDVVDRKHKKAEMEKMDKQEMKDGNYLMDEKNREGRTNR